MNHKLGYWTGFTRRYLELYPDATPLDIRRAMRAAKVTTHPPPTTVVDREFRLCNPRSPDYRPAGEEDPHHTPGHQARAEEESARRVEATDWANIMPPAEPPPHPLIGLKAYVEAYGPIGKEAYRQARAEATETPEEERNEIQQALAAGPYPSKISDIYGSWADALNAVIGGEELTVANGGTYSRALLTAQETKEARAQQEAIAAGRKWTPAQTRREQTPIKEEDARRLQKQYGVKARAEPDRIFGCPVSRVEYRSYYDWNTQSMITGARRYVLK